MNIENIYHARIPGGEPTEGLSASIIDGDRLAVQVRLEGRARTVTIDRGAATRLAVAILLGMGRKSHG